MELIINIKQANKLNLIKELLSSLKYIEIKDVPAKKEKVSKSETVSPTDL